MAVSLKQKWLRILTQIAENTQDSKIAIEALGLAHIIQLGQKRPTKGMNKQLKSIFGSQKMAKPQNPDIDKPSKD